MFVYSALSILCVVFVRAFDLRIHDKPNIAREQATEPQKLYYIALNMPTTKCMELHQCLRWIAR